jgi:hypothetical protein
MTLCSVVRFGSWYGSFWAKHTVETNKIDINESFMIKRFKNIAGLLHPATCANATYEKI